jgi:hypothetical protein
MDNVEKNHEGIVFSPQNVKWKFEEIEHLCEGFPVLRITLSHRWLTVITVDFSSQSLVQNGQVVTGVIQEALNLVTERYFEDIQKYRQTQDGTHG